MSTSLEHLDVTKRQIKPGDFVVYTSTQGRSAVLKFGRVTQLAERDGAYVGKEERTKFPTLRLVTVSRHWSQGWRLQKNGGEVTVDRLEQVMVITHEQVPVEARPLLKTEKDYVPYG